MWVKRRWHLFSRHVWHLPGGGSKLAPCMLPLFACRSATFVTLKPSNERGRYKDGQNLANVAASPPHLSRQIEIKCVDGQKNGECLWWLIYIRSRGPLYLIETCRGHKTSINRWHHNCIMGGHSGSVSPVLWKIKQKFNIWSLMCAETGN